MHTVYIRKLGNLVFASVLEGESSTEEDRDHARRRLPGDQSDRRVEFIWSSRGGFFPPYVIEGRLRNLASCAGADRREAPADLVEDLNRAGDAPPRESAYKLAEAGYKLFQEILPGDDETARKVGGWLEDLRTQAGLVSLEIVVEDGRAPKTLSVPWNLVYDERPDNHKAAFEAGRGRRAWRPFWSVRYNLTSGRRVEPLKRLPHLERPAGDRGRGPDRPRGAARDQRRRLDAFLADAGLDRGRVDGRAGGGARRGLSPPALLDRPRRAELPPARRRRHHPGRPAEPAPELRRPRERPEGMLAFLNACQTARPGEAGSFLEVLHSFGFTGAIATEQQTIDNFANEFGLDFLRASCSEGKPLGELLHALRLKYGPAGPALRGPLPARDPRADRRRDRRRPLPRRSARAAGRRRGPGRLLAGSATAGATDRRGRAARDAPADLPERPYPSLAFYDEADRLLFTGRDADVVRFSATLDRPDTRILVLHGESGLGKSSFLRAGVIPYLEEECVGYRFLRGPDGRRVIVQVSKDPVGRLAQALLDMTAAPVEYATPRARR